MSDAHLGAAPADREHGVAAFLRYARAHAKSVVINGDLFDFWFEWKSVIPRRSFRALAALAELRDAGLPVLWVAGNHDCWGGDILRDDVGADYQIGAWTGDIAGWRTRIEHGDGLRDREDRWYRFIRPVMRNPIAIKTFRMLHPDTATSIALGSSTASRVHRARDEGRGLRNHAAASLAREEGPDLLIYGHSHVAALERINGGVFANAGSWLEAPTYLVITRDRVELRSADGSAEGNRLDAVDRRA
jgi:UDP-2,3-diacylglucosamine hydrolase